MVNTILVPVAVAIVSVLVGGCAGYSIRKNSGKLKHRMQPMMQNTSWQMQKVKLKL